MIKGRKRTTSSGMFLIELIISILIFAIVSAVCVQFFVKSYQQSQQAKVLSFATTEAAAIGEIVSASDSADEAEELIRKAYIGTETEGIRTTVHFDKQFNNCKAAESVYDIMVVIDSEEHDKAGRDITADIYVTKDSFREEIYSITVMHHVAGGK